MMKSVALGTLAVLVVALAQATIQPHLVAPEMEEFVREQNERVGDDRHVWACDIDLIALLVAHCGENLRVRKKDVTWGTDWLQLDPQAVAPSWQTDGKGIVKRQDDGLASACCWKPCTIRELKEFC